MPGIRVCTKDTIATSLTMKGEDKAVDIKVEVSIKGEDIRDVVVVVAVVVVIVTSNEAVVDMIEEAVVDTIEEAESIIIKGNITIGVTVVLMDTIISQLEDISKDTSKE